MNPLLELINRLLGEALVEAGGEALGKAGGALRVRAVVLDEAGARIVAELGPALGTGELVLRLQADPPAGERQVLRLHIEQGPAHWTPALEPLRRVLERARLALHLDFGP